MNVLAFESRIRLCGAKRVRSSCFQARSQIARTTVCFVANAARDAIGALVGPVSVRAIEPRIPAASAWDALLEGALLHGVRGNVASGVLVLRRADALALAASAFGEPQRDARELSSIEQRVVRRVFSALTPALAAICGPDIRSDGDVAGPFRTYFELRVEAVVPFRLGVALRKEPAMPPAAGALRIEDLGEAAVELRAELASGFLNAQAFLNLRPGAVVPMSTKIGQPGTLKLGSATLARGVCGAAGSHYALIVE